MASDKAHDSDEDLVHLVTVDKNKVMFYADVDTQSCLKLISCITDAKKYAAGHNVTEECEEPMCVYVHVCSNGGEIFPALSVIDTMLSSKIDIVTICEGFVASAAVLIALAGKRRLMRTHSYMLIHEIRAGCVGKYSECQDDMKNNDILMDRMKSYMNERCANAKLAAKLEKQLKHDIIWSATKCLKYGLVHNIL